jgi:hypothetical protein
LKIDLQVSREPVGPCGGVMWGGISVFSPSTGSQKKVKWIVDKYIIAYK